MKKLLLVVSTAFLGAMNLNAQCTPDPAHTSSGIYPDSATNFAPACVNVPYTQLITNVVPADTTVSVLGFTTTVPIVKIDLTETLGLPPGMTIACNPSDCSFAGGTTGCAIITGTCTTPGTYNVTFKLTATLGGAGAALGPQNFTLDYYKIVVQSNCTAGIGENTAANFKMFPNPATNKVMIEGLDNETIQNISLTNAEGKLIRSYNSVNGSSMEINTADLNTGLYFVSVNHAKGTEVLKLIKE